MADEAMRSAERAARVHLHAPEAESARIAAALRAGALDPLVVQALAALGHAPACLVLGTTPAPHQDPEGLADVVAPLGAEALLRAGLAVALTARGGRLQLMQLMAGHVGLLLRGQAGERIEGLIAARALAYRCETPHFNPTGTSDDDDVARAREQWERENPDSLVVQLLMRVLERGQERVANTAAAIRLLVEQRGVSPDQARAAVRAHLSAWLLTGEEPLPRSQPPAAASLPWRVSDHRPRGCSLCGRWQTVTDCPVCRVGYSANCLPALPAGRCATVGCAGTVPPPAPPS